MKTLQSAGALLYFVADTHLSPATPENTAAFLKLLDEIRKTGGELFLLGDIFNFWANNRAVIRENLPVLEKLEELTTSGIPVYFTPGNRDFLLGERALRRYGIGFLDEESALLAGHRKILLTHGHLLATNDMEFLRYRARMWPLFRALDRLLPGFLENRLAARFMKKSKEVIGRQDSDRFAYPDDTLAGYFQNGFDQNGFDMILCGHTHRPGLREFPGGRQLVVLPAWEQGKGGYAMIKEGNVTLCSI